MNGSSKENIWLIFLQWNHMHHNDPKQNECTQRSYRASASQQFPYLSLSMSPSQLFRIQCIGQERTFSLPINTGNLPCLSQFQHHQQYKSGFHVSIETQAFLRWSDIPKCMLVTALQDAPAVWCTDDVPSAEGGNNSALYRRPGSWVLGPSLTAATQYSIHPQVPLAGPQILSSEWALCSFAKYWTETVVKIPHFPTGSCGPNAYPTQSWPNVSASFYRAGQGHRLLSAPKQQQQQQQDGDRSLAGKSQGKIRFLPSCGLEHCLGYLNVPGCALHFPIPKVSFPAVFHQKHSNYYLVYKNTCVSKKGSVFLFKYWHS